MNQTMAEIMVKDDDFKALEKTVARYDKKYGCRVMDCGRLEYAPGEDAVEDMIAVGRIEIEFLAQACVKLLRIAHGAGEISDREYVDTMERVLITDNETAMSFPLAGVVDTEGQTYYFYEEDEEASE